MRDHSTVGKKHVLVIGVFIGAAIFAFMMSVIPHSIVNEAHKKKAECEKSLPRDQYCVMQYVKRPTDD